MMENLMTNSVEAGISSPLKTAWERCKKMKRFLCVGIAFLTFSLQAKAQLPIYEKCELEAEKNEMVYSNIFSVVIDLELAYSNDLNKAMTWLYSGSLKVISWDKRTDREIRAFVTWPTDLPSQKSKSALLSLGAVDGVSVLCVSTALPF